MEAVWLIDEIQEFADHRFGAEIEVAEEEYKKEEGIEAINFEAVSDFSTWFFFTRKLGDGRTPGMVYAEEKELNEALKEKMEGLSKPVKGTFEIVRIEPVSFKLVVKDLRTQAGYELRGDFPSIKVGLTFTGTIYPWGDFYLTMGALRIQKGAD